MCVRECFENEYRKQTEEPEWIGRGENRSRPYPQLCRKVEEKQVKTEREVWEVSPWLVVWVWEDAFQKFGSHLSFQ